MINQEIKKIRISKGLSQKEMADLLFMSQASYSKIESGKTAISLDTILKILEVYKEEASNILSTYGLKITQQAGKNEKEVLSEVSLDNFYNYYKQVLDEMLMIKNKEINDLKEIINQMKNKAIGDD
ncbi:MAG: helix-turn-helix transcriptional regulator [Sediminibacterium sp.]|nr:helix-turn-helix transcriptional regulator [Sediminibacterium sp.]